MPWCLEVFLFCRSVLRTRLFSILNIANPDLPETLCNICPLRFRFTSMNEITNSFFCSSPQELLSAKDDYPIIRLPIYCLYPDDLSPELRKQLIYFPTVLRPANKKNERLN